MRKSFIILLYCLPFSLAAQVNFDRYFTDKVLRFDFMFAGNNSKITVYPVGMKEEPYFSGSRTQLVDPFNYGNFKFEIYDAAENKLLYSRGFSTLFQEWQTTAEAKVMERSFYEVATMPFPRNKIRFVLSARERNGTFYKLYETQIDPSDYFIRKEKPVRANVTNILSSGDPATCVDLVFIAEGYTENEMEKFRNDVKRLSDILLNEPPYNDYRNKFNISAVEAVSSESGTDVPGESIYVNTALNSSFYTFGTARYLTTQDMRSVNDYAALAPHDNIIVLMNSPRYGGGGVYNYYSGITSDNNRAKYLLIHEFGHGFAGLADEYYSKDVAYEEFYPLDVEPWEPNITTLVSFDSKWKKMIPAGTPVPTPVEDKYMNVTGLFEGGGYVEKGIYRPRIECLMNMSTAPGLCPVCRQAIRDMIGYYTK
ncbi:MAG TPA: M64 family metallopeptidase [Bacteroidales bacterium]|jgi:hypothetical protein|nr:peptidase M64 [Bacteroidales bacterium]OQB61617.1 MAG: IgA Peptidase M64 [Bacteroidetes bacterium ADurb.Bin145]HOU01445.1 M64 family metallopeptidase [Bacteroidales bacterium]HQG62874.1 M64 family metallopeptidase [Bacteroidales bacterium]HQK68007.1 M64 family metallopeptidase [Bacteroidales bacterium]